MYISICYTGLKFYDKDLFQFLERAYVLVGRAGGADKS